MEKWITLKLEGMYVSIYLGMTIYNPYISFCLNIWLNQWFSIISLAASPSFRHETLLSLRATCLPSLAEGLHPMENPSVRGYQHQWMTLCRPIFWVFVTPWEWHPNAPAIPSENVFRPQKTTPKTVSEGVWSCRDMISPIKTPKTHLVFFVFSFFFGAVKRWMISGLIPWPSIYTIKML